MSIIEKIIPTADQYNESIDKHIHLMLRSAVLINGGACVAILAFIGATWENGSDPDNSINLADSIWWFSHGVFTAAVATIPTILLIATVRESYYGYLSYMDEYEPKVKEYEDKSKELNLCVDRMNDVVRETDENNRPGQREKYQALNNKYEQIRNSMPCLKSLRKDYDDYMARRHKRRNKIRLLNGSLYFLIFLTFTSFLLGAASAYNTIDSYSLKKSSNTQQELTPATENHPATSTLPTILNESGEVVDTSTDSTAHNRNSANHIAQETTPLSVGGEPASQQDRDADGGQTDANQDEQATQPDKPDQPGEE